MSWNLSEFWNPYSSYYYKINMNISSKSSYDETHTQINVWGLFGDWNLDFNRVYIEIQIQIFIFLKKMECRFDDEVVLL